MSRQCFGRTFEEIFPNDPKYSNIENALQSLGTRKWNLVDKFNNIVITRIVLGNVHNSKLETKHYTQTFFNNMHNSKIISEECQFKFTLNMKCCHSTMQSQNILHEKRKTNPVSMVFFLHSPHVLCLRSNYFIYDTKIIVFNIDWI